MQTSGTKPVILAVDDDPQVARAVERDLRQQYANEYRVLRAESPGAALDILRRLRLRNEPLALLVVDQRMPEMSGVEFIAEALNIYPDAKRTLLTAYADTDAAIKAINNAHINHYLLKPWNPPEANLYPVLDDLLQDWRESFRPPFEGVRVIGTRWSPGCYAVRDFLARNHVPYRWFDPEHVEEDPETRTLWEAGGFAQDDLPIVLLPGGDALKGATPGELIGRLGLRVKPGSEFYDVAIIGGGPAGLAAAVYAASEGLRTVMVEREAPGGQAGLSSNIENYLGFPSGLSGGDLARRAVTQARRFGVEILAQEAVSLRTDGQYKVLQLQNGAVLSTHVVLLATGVQWRTLDVPGEESLRGAGVYYGASFTEALSCKDEDVYVVGGANSAGQAAMNFARYARRVVMLVRGASLSATMSQYLIDEIEKTPNIEVRPGTEIVEVHGERRLEEITIHCRNTETQERVPAASVFIFIGAQPSTAWLDGVVERDERGFIVTGQDLMRDGKRPNGWAMDRIPMLLETNIPGVFAVGDVRKNSVKRVASGVGEGAVAVQFVHQYLAKL